MEICPMPTVVQELTRQQPHVPLREIRDTTPCTNKPNMHSPNYIVQLLGNPPAMVGTSNVRIDWTCRRKDNH
ncbi:hypothetical protein Scep_012636 [Stephania cephalantha]|uniref:Uncharacterized protein n=1 Tax=Stephania cephalantha TaxID=152367 RepID=A0AAP0JFH7_9MAGN